MKNNAIKRLGHCIYLENINLILAFIINIISQPIELLIYIFGVHRITNTDMHVVLFNSIDKYTAIMRNWLSVPCVAQWVEHVNIAHLYF